MRVGSSAYSRSSLFERFFLRAGPAALLAPVGPAAFPLPVGLVGPALPVG